MATAEELIETLKQVIDPELMVNIVDLGLIYSVNEEDRKVAVEMTLTSPACPAGPQIVHHSILSISRCSGPFPSPLRLNTLYRGPLSVYARKHAVCSTAHSDGRRSLLICRFYLRPAAAQDENQILAGGGPDLHLWRVDRCHSI